MGSLLKLRDLFACRLCWRITSAVFVLILIVESAILVPSAQRFERSELGRLADHAALAIEPALLVGGALSGGKAPLNEVAAMVGQYRLAGLALFDRDGAALLRAGEHQGLIYSPDLSRRSGMMPEQIDRTSDGKRVDVAWRSSRAGEPLVIARLDAAHVRGELLSYLLRIGGLVAIIVLVVTAGTMLVLHLGVLRPLLTLRNSAMGAGADPGHAARYAVGSARRDEMGDVIRSHDAMLERIADSMRRDRAMAEERARYLSHHDPLSGMPNRTALFEFIQRLYNVKSGDSRVTLFLIHLVPFGDLNAGAGTQRADDWLLHLAAQLKQSMPAADFIAHLSTDRFAIARVDTASSNDSAYAERLLRTLREASASNGASDTQVRIGIAGTTSCGLDGPALLSRAEFALARAHPEENSAYQFFSADLAEAAGERQRLTRDLEGAIDAGELFPVYQPKLSLAAGSGTIIRSAETLLRWTSPERGAVGPDRFIPLAEATGLIVPIGDFVLNAACAQMRAWINCHGWSPRLAVNLSAQQLALPDLQTRLERALDQHHLNPGMLELEITETAAMHDVTSTATTLAGLRQLGLHLSIDDFGSGYSSLIYLHRFAVDAIKIDRSFVEGIGADHHAEAICDAVLRLGQALGTRVIAEGVETETQLEFLRRRRCDEVQGYLVGKPITAEHYAQTWITQRAVA